MYYCVGYRHRILPSYLGLPFLGCVTLGKLLQFYELQFPYSQDRKNKWFLSPHDRCEALEGSTRETGKCTESLLSLAVSSYFVSNFFFQFLMPCLRTRVWRWGYWRRESMWGRWEGRSQDLVQRSLSTRTAGSLGAGMIGERQITSQTSHVKTWHPTTSWK